MYKFQLIVLKLYSYLNGTYFLLLSILICVIFDNLYIFQVLRKQGNIGTVTVKWLLTGNPGTDVERSEGAVTFTSGAVEALLYVNVRGDPVPELDKTYQLILSDAAPVRHKKDKYFVCYVCGG